MGPVLTEMYLCGICSCQGILRRICPVPSWLLLALATPSPTPAPVPVPAPDGAAVAAQVSAPPWKVPLPESPALSRGSGVAALLRRVGCGGRCALFGGCFD
jgi:hypothetical protein